MTLDPRDVAIFAEAARRAAEAAVRRAPQPARSDVQPAQPAQLEVTRHTKYEDLPQYLSVQEAARHLGCTTWTVYQQIHRGLIPYRKIGKCFQVPKTFFHPDSVQQQVTV